MLKLLVSAALLSTSVIAEDSLERAQELWDDRANIESAKEAGRMYGRLAKQARSKNKEIEAGELYNQKGRVHYYIGETMDVKKQRDDKRFEHIKGWKAADETLKMLADLNPPKRDEGMRPGRPFLKWWKELENYCSDDILARLSDAEKEVFGDALFQKASNVGKWGEPDLTASLPWWGALKPSLDTCLIEKLGMLTHAQYGAYRIKGKVALKKAKFYGRIGGKEELQDAANFLRQAYKQSAKAEGQSVNGVLLSTYGLNTLYYADYLFLAASWEGDERKKKTAVKILNAFIAADPETFNPERVPETIQEQAWAKELLEENK